MKLATIVELSRTCFACPTQYEGTLDDGRFIYIRERHDHVRISVGDTMDDAIWPISREKAEEMKNVASPFLNEFFTTPNTGVTILEQEYKNNYLDMKELKRLLKGVLNISEEVQEKIFALEKRTFFGEETNE